MNRIRLLLWVVALALLLSCENIDAKKPPRRTSKQQGSTSSGSSSGKSTTSSFSSSSPPPTPSFLQNPECQGVGGFGSASQFIEAGNRFFGAGSYMEAAKCYKLSTISDPNQPMGWSNLGLALSSMGDIDNAIFNIENALKINPGMVEAYHALAAAYSNRGEYQKGASALLMVIQLNPTFAAAYNNLGNLYLNMQQTKLALDAYRSAVKLAPNQGDVHANLARLLCSLNQFEEGNKEFQTAVNLEPKNALILQEYGIALRNRATADRQSPGGSRSRMDEAERMLTAALRLNPNLADSYYHLGEILSGDIFTENKRIPQAIKAHTTATTLNPRYAESYMSLAMLYWGQGNLEVAEKLLKFSMEAKPFAEAAANLGIVQSDMGKYDDALATFKKAQRLNPNLAEGYKCMGDTLKHLNRWSEAASSYEQALAIRGDYFEALNDLTHALQHTCDWDRWASSLAKVSSQLESELSRGNFPIFVKPFHALIYPLLPRHMLLVAKSYAKRAIRLTKSLLPAPLPSPPPPAASSPLHIGYVSSNIGDHSLSHLMLNVFAMHGKNLKTFIFALNPDDKSSYRKTIKKTVGNAQFFDFSDRGGAAAAQAINSLNIHLLIDLVGYTGGGEKANEIFALRPSPVASSYMGFCFSTGAEYMQFITVDRIVAPPENIAHFTEKLLIVPNSYFVTDHRQSFQEVTTAVQTVTRSEFNLPPPPAVIFACHNQLYKIDKKTFSLWMSLLKQSNNNNTEDNNELSSSSSSPSRILWLLRFPPYAEENIRSSAKKAGIEGSASPSSQLVFSEPLPKTKYMRRIAVADLFLDTPLVNAHTSATDALWAGLPLLTLPRETMITRVAASLLLAADRNELVSFDDEDYLHRASVLAAQPHQLAKLRKKVWESRENSPLFDTALWVRNYDLSMFMAWECHIFTNRAFHVVVNSKFATRKGHPNSKVFSTVSVSL